MTAHDWAAWMAGKALVAAAVAAPKGPAGGLRARRWPSAELDGSKGVRMSFRAWDGQLRQPLLLTDGQGVIAHGADRRPAAPEERARHAGRRRAGAACEALVQRPPPRHDAHALQALRAIVVRELLKFSRQYGRLVSALVRPLLWLAVFAAGFRNVFGVAIVEPYDTYIPYDVYIAPGLVGMVLLFNGMQSSPGDGLRPRDGPDAAAAHRAAAALRGSCSASSCATAVLSLAAGRGLRDRRGAAGHHAAGAAGRRRRTCCWPRCAAALMLGALGLLLSVHIKQLENFAGTMNFVIFPMYFMSTALYPLWKLEESGAELGLPDRPLQPLHPRGRVDALRAVRQGPGRCRRGSCSARWLLCFALACWGYDPQRGFGQLTKRGGAAS